MKLPQFEVFGTSRRDFALVFVLLFNAFTWSYMILMMIGNMTVGNVPVVSALKSSFSTVFSIAAAGAGLSGAILSEKMNKLRLLYFWMFLGLLSSIPLLFVNYLTVAHLSLLFILLGISFGLGMPSCLSFLADHSNVENRASLGSFILLASNLSTLPLAVFAATLGSVANALALVAWRGFGLIGFLLMKPKEGAHSIGQKRVSFRLVLRDRSFGLYFVPWVVFSLIDTFEKSLLVNFLTEVGRDLPNLMLTIEPLVSVVFIFICGILADRVGRKRMAIYGFVSLGIGYAIVGLAPGMRGAWYFYFIVDGIAWSIFFTIFLLTLAGDLSQTNNREKYYAIASFPYVIRSAIPLLFGSALTPISMYAAFSLASFFLFVAVLPLMYAQETLPDKKIELRRLKGYVEQAKKVKGKHDGKDGDKKT